MIWYEKTKFYRLILLVIMMCNVFYIDNAMGARIYKWVDEKGVVHFSDREPEVPRSTKGAVEEREVKGSVPGKSDTHKRLKAPARSPIEYAVNCTFAIKGSSITGAGFFISPNGYAVTCRHVIQEGEGQIALLSGERELPFKVISSSHTHDMAIILVLTYGLKPHYLSFRDSGTLVPGERIFTIGAPAGLQATVTDGVFTGFRKRKSTGERVIQFSAPINPGNSGGPLIDENGKVVGVVASKYLKKGDVVLSGLGFAVPSSCVVEAYGEYMK